MPFIEQESRPFAREGIEWVNPNQLGVYGLFNRDAWVYVGRGDIRQRLLDHLNGDNYCITSARPTHFVAEVHPDPEARADRGAMAYLQSASRLEQSDMPVPSNSPLSRLK